MFAQTFCDSPLELSRKKWTTLFSFGLEAIAVVALISVPLLHMETLPPTQMIAPIFTPILRPVPVEEPVASAGQTSLLLLGELHSNQLKTPSSIPNTISTSSPIGEAPTVPWGDGNAKNPIGQIIGSSPVRPVGQSGPARPTRVSGGVMEGALIEKIQPVYPRAALITHTEGEVVLRAVISRTGTIENLQVISGSPFLSRAAIDALRQWRYRPYELSGQAVEVETQIVLNFTLSGNN